MHMNRLQERVDNSLPLTGNDGKDVMLIIYVCISDVMK